MQIELQNTSQTMQKFLENASLSLSLSLSQRHLLLFLVCQGIQKYTRMDLLMTERLRSWLHISVPKIVLSIPNTLIKAAALWSYVCMWVFSIPRMLELLKSDHLSTKLQFWFWLSLTWIYVCENCKLLKFLILILFTVCVCVCYDVFSEKMNESSGCSCMLFSLFCDKIHNTKPVMAQTHSFSFCV